MRLRELREEKAYSQRELAARSGVGADTIYRLERAGASAKAHPRTIRKLAEALGVEPREMRGARDARDA